MDILLLSRYDKCIMMHNNRPQKESIYLEFVRWFAMSHPEKLETGILDQNGFSEKYKVDKVTLSRWKQRPEFEILVDKNRSRWAVGKTPNVLFSIYQSAVKGDPKSQLLFLKYFKRFSPGNKGGNSKHDGVEPMHFAEDDMRHLISLLPKWRQTKYNTMILELVRDADLTLKGEVIPKDPEPSDGPGWNL